MIVIREAIQLSPTLCHLMDYSLPGSSVCGISQARILEWVAISFSRVSSWPRDWTQVSCIAGRLFTIWATSEGRIAIITKLKTLEINISHKLSCKVLKNISKSNPTIYTENYIPWASGIYTRYERLVQHLKNQWIKSIIPTGMKNHITILTDAEKT